MAQRTRPRSAASSADARERLAVVETRLEEAVNALTVAVDQLTATVQAQAQQIAALQTAQAYGAGAGRVEQQARTQAQEWARLLFPYLVAFAAAAIGWRALPG